MNCEHSSSKSSSFLVYSSSFMNTCPISYLPCGTEKYAPEGLRRLHKSLTDLSDFPFSAPEQRLEATQNMGKMSIQGVQPKLSVVLNLKKQAFETVEKNGRFILKPQHENFLQLPENEDLTMRLAAAVGIETPFHGMVFCKDASLSYFIKRFDRAGKNEKIPVEDFAQLAGQTRETKYDYTIEKTIKIIESHCTFPAPEKLKFYRLLIFCFLTGNEDMHLKNFSLITRNGRVELSPAYDLLNSTLVLEKTEEEMALKLAGKRKNLQRRELVDYLGREKLGLPEPLVLKTLGQFFEIRNEWEKLVAASFLSEKLKAGYLKILAARFARF